MSQYYEVVCHDCKVSWQPSSKRLDEIKANIKALAEVGAFLVEHRHHRVDLVGDSGDDGKCDWDMVNRYCEMAWFELSVVGGA
jgi:hypothetical protein